MTACEELAGQHSIQQTFRKAVAVCHCEKVGGNCSPAGGEDVLLQ